MVVGNFQETIKFISTLMEQVLVAVVLLNASNLDQQEPSQAPWPSAKMHVPTIPLVGLFRTTTIQDFAATALVIEFQEQPWCAPTTATSTAFWALSQSKRAMLSLRRIVTPHWINFNHTCWAMFSTMLEVLRANIARWVNTLLLRMATIVKTMWNKLWPAPMLVLQIVNMDRETCNFSNAKIIAILWIRVKLLALSRLTTSTVPVIFTRQPSWNCHRPIPWVFRVQKFKSVPSAVLAQQGRFNARKGKYLVKIVVLVRFKMRLDRPRAKRVRSRPIKIKQGKRRARSLISLAMQG